MALPTPSTCRRNAHHHSPSFQHQYSYLSGCIITFGDEEKTADRARTAVAVDGAAHKRRTRRLRSGGPEAVAAGHAHKRARDRFAIFTSFSRAAVADDACRYEIHCRRCCCCEVRARWLWTRYQSFVESSSSSLTVTVYEREEKKKTKTIINNSVAKRT